MIKNPVTLAVAAAAVLTTIAMTALSPVSASSYSASTGYLPAQIENHGTAIESVPADAFGDLGLSKTFPVEAPVNLEDAAPQMYS
jgi:hypothetical protein